MAEVILTGHGTGRPNMHQLDKDCCLEGDLPFFDQVSVLSIYSHDWAKESWVSGVDT